MSNEPTVLEKLSRLNRVSESCEKALHILRRRNAPASEIAKLESQKAEADREFNAIGDMIRRTQSQ